MLFKIRLNSGGHRTLGSPQTEDWGGATRTVGAQGSAALIFQHVHCSKNTNNKYKGDTEHNLEPLGLESMVQKLH